MTAVYVARLRGTEIARLVDEPAKRASLGAEVARLRKAHKGQRIEWVREEQTAEEKQT